MVGIASAIFALDPSPPDRERYEPGLRLLLGRFDAFDDLPWVDADAVRETEELTDPKTGKPLGPPESERVPPSSDTEPEVAVLLPASSLPLGHHGKDTHFADLGLDLEDLVSVGAGLLLPHLWLCEAESRTAVATEHRDAVSLEGGVEELLDTVFRRLRITEVVRTVLAARGIDAHEGHEVSPICEAIRDCTQGWVLREVRRAYAASGYETAVAV